MNMSNQLTQPKGPMNYEEFEAMLRNHPHKAPGDEEIIDLILTVSKYSQSNPPPNLKETREWRRAQNQLIRELQSLENLANSSHPEFAEAKNYILGVMSTRLRELKLFEGRSIQANLAVFLNNIGQLKYRKIELYRQDPKKPDSLDRPVGESGQTLADSETAKPPETWTQPMLPWDKLIQQETKTAAEILQQIRDQVEADPGKKLRNCHLKKCPACNAQVVIIKHKLGKQTLDSLAADFGQPIGTVRAFWTRRVFPMLKEIAAQYYQD
ncbi:MAG: hypothetical protein AB4352_01945 [Hormoscilla sp.]